MRTKGRELTCARTANELTTWWGARGSGARGIMTCSLKATTPTHDTRGRLRAMRSTHWLTGGTRSVLARLSTACIFLSNARAIQSIAPSSFTFTRSIPPAARSEVCGQRAAARAGWMRAWCGVCTSASSRGLRSGLNVCRIISTNCALRSMVTRSQRCLPANNPRAVSTHSHKVEIRVSTVRVTKKSEAVRRI
jgi:hypothetical protein